MTTLDYWQSHIEGFLQQNRKSLSKIISLFESQKKEDQPFKKHVWKSLISKGSSTTTIGVTGSPGAGKSTLLNSIGKALLEKGFKIAVISVDPSSIISGGSILGDKIRMPDISYDSNCYIRPIPSLGSYGGLSPAVYPIIQLIKVYGFDYVFIETVGSGQNEIDVTQIAEKTIWVTSPFSGDDIQSLKKGILEHIHDIIITHATAAYKEKYLQTHSYLNTEGHRNILLFSPDQPAYIEDITRFLEETAKTIIPQHQAAFDKTKLWIENNLKESLWKALKEHQEFQSVLEKYTKKIQTDPSGFLDVIENLTQLILRK